MKQKNTDDTALSGQPVTTVKSLSPATFSTTSPAHYQQFRNARYFDVCAVFFVALLIISNVAATKLISLSLPYQAHLVFDGGAVLFPFTYLLGDVLSEVYGFKAARRVIYLGFAGALLASLTFWVVSIAPPGPGYFNDKAFASVLGFVPRIVAASLAGYLVGQILNSLVLVRIKDTMATWLKTNCGERHLWVRLVASTLVGELADTLIFCTIAFGGLISFGELVNYTVTGYVYKCGVEIICLPITYPVIRFIKRRESDYYGKAA